MYHLGTLSPSPHPATPSLTPTHPPLRHFPPPPTHAALYVMPSCHPITQKSSWALPPLPCPHLHSLFLRSPFRLLSALSFPATIINSEPELASRPASFFPTYCGLILGWLLLTDCPTSRCLKDRPTQPVLLVLLLIGGWGGRTGSIRQPLR